MPKNVTAVFYDMENLVGGEGFRYDIDFRRIAAEVKSIQVDKSDLNIIAAFAYANWSNAKYDSIKNLLPSLGIQATHTKAFNYEQRQKNLADIQLSLDALAMYYDTPHVETFVIVSGDGCYSLLAEKLRFGLKKVVCVGFQDSFSHVLRECCDVSVTLNPKLRVDIPPTPPPRAITAPHFNKSQNPPRRPPSPVPNDRVLKTFVLEQVKKAGDEPLKLSDLQSAMCQKFTDASYGKLTGAKFVEMLSPLLENTVHSIKMKGIRRVIVTNTVLKPPPPVSTKTAPTPPQSRQQQKYRPTRMKYNMSGFTALPTEINLKSIEIFAEKVLVWIKEKEGADKVELKDFYDVMCSLEPQVQYMEHGFFDHQQFLLYLFRGNKYTIVRDKTANRYILLREPIQGENVQTFKFNTAQDYTIAQVKKAVGLLSTDLDAVKRMLDRLVAASWQSRGKQDFFDEYVLPYSGEKNGGLFMHILGSLMLIVWRNDVVTRSQELTDANFVEDLMPFIMQGVRKKVAATIISDDVFRQLENELREGFLLPKLREEKKNISSFLFRKKDRATR
ncbi:MAG: NYN domain-containing protein [Oscillospiraceae bacterium]|nr:NYN domain-containing protein [Oscillospiraceae bacterium]